MAKKEKRIIYYSDELNDEFSDAVITPRRIDGKWKYIHTSLWKKFTHFFWYRIVATPLAFTYLKHKYHHKFIGKNKVKPYKEMGVFCYGNHTNDMADPLIPNYICIPNDAYFIVHPNNVSMPFLGKITPSLGALPLPDDLEASKNFVRAIETRIKQKHFVIIYPEAHIWPFYTKIRPFTSASFRYPVMLKTPVFAFTNVYNKRKHSKRPKMTTYIDGPFFPDEGLKTKDAMEKLRNEVYAAMVERSKLNDIEMITYIKGEKNND